MALAGCVTTMPVIEDPDNRYNVGQRLLTPESSGAAAGAVQAYRLAASETFRMPEPVQSPPPVMPADYARQTLPPTTLCVRVIIAAEGQVERVEPLLEHASCTAGRELEHASLLQASIAAATQWTFRPAAICHFSPGSTPIAQGDCTGAVRVEQVPVTLLYAFTFEVVKGEARVRSQTGVR
ncbi:hypothetical protein ABB26_06470 [Stenotrophomonas humi]|uniref:TonB C-terminal domain-containing protein n=2 Tax=Stenotrophomonas humi TaxID=405444 RepID=A0A0R0C4H4_9GAMM|nr:hypothetical protein ABB26_06470 [Stenotrophomonas humi]